MCSIQKSDWRYDRSCVRRPCTVFACRRWVRMWWKDHHNRVRTLIRDPLASLSDLMNTCIFNTYIPQALPRPLCRTMEWLGVCEFHLKFYLIESICNWRKQLWLVTDASKAKYLPNKKRSAFSVFMSAQLNSSGLNGSCSFIFSERKHCWQNSAQHPRAGGKECASKGLPASLAAGEGLVKETPPRPRSTGKRVLSGRSSLLQCRCWPVCLP